MNTIDKAVYATVFGLCLFVFIFLYGGAASGDHGVGVKPGSRAFTDPSYNSPCLPIG